VCFVGFGLEPIPKPVPALRPWCSGRRNAAYGGGKGEVLVALCCCAGGV